MHLIVDLSISLFKGHRHQRTISCVAIIVGHFNVRIVALQNLPVNYILHVLENAINLLIGQSPLRLIFGITKSLSDAVIILQLIFLVEKGKVDWVEHALEVGGILVKPDNDLVLGEIGFFVGHV